MLSRYVPSFRANLAWKLFIIVGLAALVISLGSALIVRGAPASSTTYACVSRYTNQMRWVPSSGKCNSNEFETSWNSFEGANLDAAYVNEGQVDSITSPMILDGTVNSADLGTGSVGSDEVIDNSLTAADLGTGSVTADEIFDGTIEGVDLNPALSATIDAQTLEGYQITSANFTVSANTSLTSGLVCPVGTTVIGGGVNRNFAGNVFMGSSYPASSTQWNVEVQNNNANDVSVTAYAICMGP